MKRQVLGKLELGLGGGQCPVPRFDSEVTDPMAEGRGTRRQVELVAAREPGLAQAGPWA
ncbi:MAG: hypothetical protein AB1816_02420 [Bacillota bacterium]